ncbi:MAG: hypothetical protein OJF59_000505 [Cytophagales bacterium]|jgi:tetratricopeptide (TPR) repeat protein|nr:hypothetical protein [Bacteroidota bacterium]WHZ06752.1 MAG: hypothetical protein OJF59_000505 [Cytophagales bacterium]
MKKVKNLTVIGLLLFPWFAQSQDYTFRVLANKGTNEVKSGNSWIPIKTGAQLKKGDELKISENASVGLVHVTGKPLEVKQAGNYKVDDLSAKVGSGSTSVLNKYTDFILSSNSPEAKKNRLIATGGVHRGVEDIKVFLPESQFGQVFEPTVFVNWGASKASPPYVVSVKNMFGDVLSETETPEKLLQLDLNDPKYAKETPVLVEVRSKAEGKTTSTSHAITRLSGDRYNEVKKQLDADMADLNEETAFNEYLKASIFEQKKLYIDAITCYEKAMKLDPQNPTYKEGYDEFLLRNKLKTDK